MQGDSDTLRLSSEELDLLRWLLPADRSGYDDYFNNINALSLLGTGRWGPGDYIFGQPGDIVETSGPMERVFAYGNLSFSNGSLGISVHEKAGGQIEVQFAPTGELKSRSLNAVKSRYCYSYWRPGDRAPKSDTTVREVPVDQQTGTVLVLSKGDERIWLHQLETGVNNLIPHMKFHNELMRQTGVRDKEKVFNPKLAMQHDSMFSDNILRETFLAYNKVWTKVIFPDPPRTENESEPGLFRRLFKRT